MVTLERTKSGKLDNDKNLTKGQFSRTWKLNKNISSLTLKNIYEV